MHLSLRCRVAAFILVSAGLSVMRAQVYSFTTFAGVAGVGGLADGVGTGARFIGPMGMAIDPAGNLYVTDGDTIRKITPAGVVTTIAGGTRGSADGVGTAAQFRNPQGIAADSAGNLYVADTSNATIRKIGPGGVVTTIAGLAGSLGSNDGIGSAARFSTVVGVAVDSFGNIYVGDVGNQTLRKITPSGVVSTYAGSGGFGTADGVGTSAQFISLQGVAVDGNGNVYVTDVGRIRKITPDRTVTTLAGVGNSGGWHDGTGASVRFSGIIGIASDRAGNLFVCDHGNRTICRVTPAGAVTTIAGRPGAITSATDGIGGNATFREPFGIAVDGAGTVFVADLGAAVIRRGAVATNPAPTRLVNMSALARITPGRGPLIIGFTIGGAGTKPLVARAVGPTLAAFGVSNPDANPAMQMNAASGALIGSNDDWGGGAVLSAAFARVGAFALPGSSKDAALSPSVGAGGYTAQVSLTNGAVLTELYDADTAGASRLTNLSFRAQVDGTTANVALLGFVIVGDLYKTILVRGIGPSLAQFGVTDAVSSVPFFGVFGEVIETPEPDETIMRDLSAKVGAFPLTSNSRDASMLFTLAPGNYSVAVNGPANTTGSVLVEVYEVP